MHAQCRSPDALCAEELLPAGSSQRSAHAVGPCAGQPHTSPTGVPPASLGPPQPFLPLP